MISAALLENEWIEDETFLAEHWDEMTISSPGVPVAGIWKDGMHICIYCDPVPSPPAALKN